jgi:Skp family chaperone for outer membrane proteins
MRTASAFAAAVGIAAGSVAFLLGRAAPATAADGAPLKVGVVDILAVLNQAPAKEQIEKDNKARKEELSTWGKAEAEKLAGLQKALELMARDANPKAYREKEHEFLAAKANADFEGKWRTSQAAGAYADSLEALYDQVRTAIHQVASEKGLTLVLYKTDDRLNLRSPDEFVPNIAARPVLHWDSAMDVTQDVKLRLATARPPTPAPGPAPAPSMDGR